MQEARVSVVIPVYNNAAYVGAAVDSVLTQTCAPAEVIVVDDGSIDGTAAVLDSYRGRIKYVYQTNRGEPAARNRGIREATGEYIAFLDGDDLWLPNKLELQLQYFTSHPHCSLVYTDMSTFDENGVIDGSVKSRFRMDFPSGHIFKSLFMRSLFGSGSVVFRKECLELVGYFDEGLLVGSDYEMWLRIARHFDLGAVDKPLLMYRHHATMSTRGLGLKMQQGVPWEVLVLQKILRLYPGAIEELGQSTVNRRMARPYAGLAYARFRSGDYEESRFLFRKAMAYWPTNGRYWGAYLATFLHPAQIAAARRLYRIFIPHAQENTGQSKIKAA